MSGGKKFWTTTRASIAVFFSIAIVAIAVLAWAWSASPQSNTLRYEVAKTSLQVLAVAILGSLATLATLSFTQSRTRKEDLHDKKLERWQRRVSDRRDKRHRQDELLRSTLQATVTSYNRVKRVRRLLLAETQGSSGRSITIETYDKYMAVLIDQQLEFEQFTKLAPLINDERLNAAAVAASVEIKTGNSLAKHYSEIEVFLNRVIDEYQTQRYSMAGGSTFPVFHLPRLTGFLSKEEFSPGVSTHIASIVEALQVALLQPLALPDPEEEENLTD
ncbi:hypothetical protein [Streptomyces sp. NPDC055506]